MTIGDRLKEERQRLGVNQTDMAALAGTTKKSQIDYEKGISFPNASYLAAIAGAGADVRYIVTGDRDAPAPPPPLSAEEQLLLNGFRALDAATRRRMLAFVFGGESATSGGQSQSQTIHGDVGQQIRVEGNLDQSGVSFSVGGKRKR